jgi:hypothetical protein
VATAAIVLFALAAEMLAMRAVRLPPFVDRIAIENRTEYKLEVDVAGAERDLWLDLGAVNRKTTKTIEAVIDQGDTWVFRLHYGGENAGEFTVSRDDLVRDRWRAQFPDEAGHRLAGMGVPPSVAQ